MINNDDSDGEPSDGRWTLASFWSIEVSLTAKRHYPITFLGSLFS